ncbi:MAG TPA: glycine cleavage system aminomethyltransferase GcvT, partial [Candidatus Dormibacteraeota bacterium]
MGKRTPLYDRHVALGARMVDFGGFDMPLQYSSIRAEHTAVRERAGLFDVSHMGEVVFGGRGAEAAVQLLVANDVSRLAPGGALYGVMSNLRGGIVDDVIVNRGHSGEHLMMVVNAARRDADLAWIRAHAGADARVHDASDELALLAVQGPAAVGIVAALAEADIAALRPFTAVGARLAGLDAQVSVVSRTGYTGEDGVEIYIDAARAPALWDALLDAGSEQGLLPAGLAARDTLRLEAGLRLYGQDMDEDTDPYSAGLGWTVKLDKGEFLGREALRRLHDQGPPRHTLGLRFEGRAIARHGQAVLHDGAVVGEVT